jgi:hypothetical protein
MNDHRYPHEDDLLEPAEPSREAVTPRGGFMARPGLKPPPRHAVVVRVGDAPATKEIPRARGSKPPPPPLTPPVSARLSEDEKDTLRCIPTPSPTPLAVGPVSAPAPLSAPAPASNPAPAPAPVVLESVPPPSDMPVVASVRPESTRGRASRSSRTAITLAAAAGLTLGLGSVAMNRWHQTDEPPVAGAVGAPAEPGLAPAPQLSTPVTLASSAPAPSHSATPAAAEAASAAPPRPPVRRNIF